MNLINNKIYEGFEPLPKDLTGWNGNSQVFVNLISELRPKVIIEVGSWKGQSAINMGNTVKSLGLDTKIHCVDTWLGAIEFWTSHNHTSERNLLQRHGYPQIYYQFLSNVVHSNLQDTILPFPNTSENGFRYFRDTNIKSELIYIDASHEEEDVYKDIKNYYTLLNEGGVIFGDDYTKNWSGVVTSVNKFADEIGKSVEVLGNNFWLIRK